MKKLPRRYKQSSLPFLLRASVGKTVYTVSIFSHLHSCGAARPSVVQWVNHGQCDRGASWRAHISKGYRGPVLPGTRPFRAANKLYTEPSYWPWKMTWVWPWPWTGSFPWPGWLLWWGTGAFCCFFWHLPRSRDDKPLCDEWYREDLGRSKSNYVCRIQIKSSGALWRVWECLLWRAHATIFGRRNRTSAEHVWHGMALWIHVSHHSIARKSFRLYNHADLKGCSRNGRGPRWRFNGSCSPREWGKTRRAVRIRSFRAVVSARTRQLHDDVWRGRHKSGWVYRYVME